MGAPLSGSTRQYSWEGMQSSSSRPVSKKREPSKAISLRLETSLVPGSGPSRLSEVVERRVVEVVKGEGEKAEQQMLLLLLCSSDVVAHRARTMDDFVAVADMVSFSNLLLYLLCSTFKRWPVPIR